MCRSSLSMTTEFIQYFNTADAMCKAGLSMITDFITLCGSVSAVCQARLSMTTAFIIHVGPTNAMCEASLSMIPEFIQTSHRVQYNIPAPPTQCAKQASARSLNSLNVLPPP